MGSKSAKKKQQKGRARPGTASTGCGAAGSPAGPAAQRGQTRLTAEEFLAELARASQVTDLKGAIIDHTQGSIDFSGRGVTIANCTIKCRAGSVVSCKPILGRAPHGIRFKNVTFEGPGTGCPARDVPQPPEPVGRGDGLVVVTGACGVAFEDCTFKNAAPSDGLLEGILKMGLFVSDSTVRVDNCRFVNNMGHGLCAVGSGSVVVVNNSESSGNHGAGVCAQLGACVDVAGSQLNSNGTFGLEVSDGRARATGTTCSGNLYSGAAVLTGTAVLDGCRMSDNVLCGINAKGSGTVVTTTDLECVWTAVADPAACTFGVHVDHGAQCTIRGGKMVDNRTGLYVCKSGGSITASDVVCSGGEFGAILGAGTLRLERATLRRNSGAGVLLNGTAGIGGARDVRAHLERCTISGSDTGVRALGAKSRADLNDVEISGCVASGVAANEGAEVAMRGGCVTHGKGFGVRVSGLGTVVAAVDVDFAHNGRYADLSGEATLTVNGHAVRKVGDGPLMVENVMC